MTRKIFVKPKTSAWKWWTGTLCTLAGLAIAANGAGLIDSPWVWAKEFRPVASLALDARYRQKFRDLLDVEERLERLPPPTRGFEAESLRKTRIRLRGRKKDLEDELERIERLKQRYQQ